MRKAIALLCLLSGCAHASTPPTIPHTIPEERWVEARNLPPDPHTEALPPNTPGDESQVAPYEPGDPGNPRWPGIVESEARAQRDALYRIRYAELRRWYEADRQVWVAHREAYETRLQLASERIQELQPSRWERHRGAILGASGFLVGVATSILIVYGVDRALTH